MLLTRTSRRPPSRGGRFAIIGARYNERFTNALVRAARAELTAATATVTVFRVPGAFEIPVVAAALTRQDPTAFDALLCFGVIIRGETAHADLIGRAVTDALMRLQLEWTRPVIHEVLLLDNEAQARARCLGPHNRGREAAHTALEMAALLRQLLRIVPPPQLGENPLQRGRTKPPPPARGRTGERNKLPLPAAPQRILRGS